MPAIYIGFLPYMAIRRFHFLGGSASGRFITDNRALKHFWLYGAALLGLLHFALLMATFTLTRAAAAMPRRLRCRKAAPMPIDDAPGCRY